MSLLDLTLKDLHELVQKKEVTAAQLVEAAAERIEALDPTIQAFITVDLDSAKESAARLDEAFDKQGTGDAGSLFGIAHAVQDNLMTKQMKTTLGSKFMEDFTPVYDATTVENLAQAYSVLVGKTNLDEMGIGQTTENSATHSTYNPWNQEHVAGGAGGGAAAAVASRQVYYALSSDTGGSIRVPASYCGVVGLKPTYGLVSRYGLASVASSMDQVGTVTKTVEDAAYLLNTIAGHDPKDSTSVSLEQVNYVQALDGKINGLRIAVPEEFLSDNVDTSVKEATMETLNKLKKLGATWDTVSLPHFKHAMSTYYLLSSAEASSNLARYDGVRYGYRTAQPNNLLHMYEASRAEAFSDELKLRTFFGNYVLSADQYEQYYVQAQKVRTLIKRDFAMLFAKYDVVIGPTTPTTALKINTTSLEERRQSELFTIPASLTGLPAISIPVGLSDGGLPIGLQVIGKSFEEQMMLRVAHVIEQNTEPLTLKL